MNGLMGFGIKELARTEEGGKHVYPDRSVIKEKIGDALIKAADEIGTKSQAKVRAVVYQVDTTSGVVRVTPTGDTTTIQLYGTSFVKETVTVAALLAPLGDQFAYAARAIEKNNEMFEAEYKGYQTRLAALQQRLTEAGAQYTADIASKAQQLDQEKTNAASIRDQNNQLSARVDEQSGKNQTDREAFVKEMRKLGMTNSALLNRLRQKETAMEIAIKEDPKDGEVLVSDARQGLVWLNRGKNFRVAPGMKFQVWRVGKGNVRENVADVEVISVDDTKSMARVLKLHNPRVPVSERMSFSSPLYDPFKKLRVHIAGTLTYYPSDLAKRRLAESGCTLSDRLDDTVDVVILGVPEVEISTEAASPEEQAANEEKARAQRAARVKETVDLAATLGAVVVAEDVLRTFLEY
jgi:hypothetical protein